jgi:hypothetical protein
MLSRAELEDLSLFYFVKEGILARLFSQDAQGVKLVNDPALYNGTIRTNYLIPDPTNPAGRLAASKGRGFLSFNVDVPNLAQIYDPTTSSYVTTYGTPFFNQAYSIPMEREYNYITVRDQNGSVMDRSDYQIDYEKCRIRYPAPTTNSGLVASGIYPASIDFRYHSVAVVDGWPTDEKVSELPVVSIYPQGGSPPKGFQIGPGVEFNRTFILEVFAMDSANRKNLLDLLENALYNKSAPVIDFNRTGQPLEQHGIINKKFLQDLEYNNQIYRTYLTLNRGNGNNLYFINIETDYNVAPRTSIADLTRHVGKLKITTRSYTDRDPSLIGKFNSLEMPIGGLDSLTVKAYS